MIVIDTETTGMGEEDQVIELAAISQDIPGGRYHFMVRPSVPVHVEARATHHISPRQLECCADAAAWRETLDNMMLLGPVVFHNAEFDKRLIRQTWADIALPPVICTWRCALHLWPEAPSHSNQVLRYWRDLEPVIRTGLPPHRALPDAAVTAAIVQDMLRTHTLEQLIELTTQPVVLYRCGFGKHRGELWSDVPKDYLQWIVKQSDFDPDTAHTARYYLGQSGGTADHTRVVYRGTTIEPGGRYTFNWRPDRDEGPGGDGCAEHAGQVVRVTKLLHHGMVAVVADDGWTTNAFHHELRTPDAKTEHNGGETGTGGDAGPAGGDDTPLARAGSVI